MHPAHLPLLELTQEILACRKCRTDRTTFVAGRTALTDEWMPPRGWAGLGLPKTDLVVVSLNPGHPLPAELEHYARIGLAEEATAVTSDQAASVNEMCLRQYRAPRRGRNWIFHRKSVALSRSLLWLMDGEDPGPRLWERCWFTDVFKCSTRRESSPQITAAALAACRPYLERELNVLSPRLVVALGTKAQLGLQRAGVARFATFRHPSNGCPRLDAGFHDRAFRDAAEILGSSIPDTFREVRRIAYEDAHRWL